MIVRMLDQQSLNGWVDALIARSRVVGVQAKGDRFTLDDLSAATDLRLDYDVTILPPKKYFLPQEEVLLRFKGEHYETVIEAEPFVLFGVHPYDAVAWVGQHAKAGTEYSHLTHTQHWNYVDLSINGVSIGELGQFAMCASELGVPGIFASGEKALAAEATGLMPWIEAVWVKEGTTPGRGDELDLEAYSRFNWGAIHFSPSRAREIIQDGAIP